MCTTICSSATVRGAARRGAGWFPVLRVTVAYDHPAHVGTEHALLIDFADPDRGPGARVGVELDLESGRELLRRLQNAVDAAESYEAAAPLTR
jgi:hypothetical protein